MEACAHCHALHADPHKVLVCGGCRQRSYCDRRCHRAAWRAGHNQECKHLLASSAPSVSSASGREGGDGPSVLPGNQSPSSPQEHGDPAANAGAEPDQNISSPQEEEEAAASGGTEPNASPLDEDTVETGDNTLWLNIFKCFNCGKQGHDLIRCCLCEDAYYCDNDKCELDHASRHERVCIAAVSAKAQQERREQLARAVREKGKDNVEGAEDDRLCVICHSTPVDAVEVRMYGVVVRGSISLIIRDLIRTALTLLNERDCW